ncbi:hypothetical protein N665_0754s0010 [Sinapis alba]|nr:hypothetical protein N665_0754s0010 [Sinapis alba]
MEYTRSGSSSSSTDESVINYKEKKPCERCGSNANDDLIMTCFNCRVTREHIYCAQVLFKTVPNMWICDECCALIRILFIKNGFAKGPNKTANSRRLNRAYNQEEPCEICGNVGIACLMMVCFECRDTHQHTYCTRVFLPSVPPIWICEACHSSSRVLAENQMDSETNVVEPCSDPKNSHSSIVDDHETAKVRANDMEQVVATYKSTSCEISANVNSMIHPPMQPHTSSLAKETSSVFNDSSQNNEQHQPSQPFPKKRKTFQLMGTYITL